MLAKYFPIFQNYVLSVSSQRKYNFYQENTLLDTFGTNSRNIIGRRFDACATVHINIYQSRSFLCTCVYIRLDWSIGD